MGSKSTNYWRVRIFIITWGAYAFYYFGRKNFSVLMPSLSGDLGYSKDSLAALITTYSLLYMIGQFLSGYNSDKLGPRKIVTLGLFISAVANFFMGFAGSIGVLFVLMGFNGLGQSTGWSGLVKNMTPWFRATERGVIMSWWTTCYVVGGFAATLFATYWATNGDILPAWGWQRGFWMPSLVMLAYSILYYFITRNRPVEVGLPPIVEETTTSKFDWAKVKGLLSQSTLWIAGVIYFILKLTRYAFLFWLPLYMTEALQYSQQKAGYTSSSYELAGFIGVLVAGYVSDKLYASRRFPITVIMLFALALVCLAQPLLSPLGLWANILGIGLIGLATYGPDSILSGAVAMDIGGKEGAATAAGFINGVGSMGQLLSPIVVAFVTDKYGWDSLFYLFVILALLAALLAMFRWNYRG